MVSYDPRITAVSRAGRPRRQLFSDPGSRTVSGISITTASGGLAEENGFNVNSGSSTILGFSFGAGVGQYLANEWRDLRKTLAVGTLL